MKDLIMRILRYACPLFRNEKDLSSNTAANVFIKKEHGFTVINYKGPFLKYGLLSSTSPRGKVYSEYCFPLISNYSFFVSYAQHFEEILHTHVSKEPYFKQWMTSLTREEHFDAAEAFYKIYQGPDKFYKTAFLFPAEFYEKLALLNEEERFGMTKKYVREELKMDIQDLKGYNDPETGESFPILRLKDSLADINIVFAMRSFLCSPSWLDFTSNLCFFIDNKELRDQVSEFIMGTEDSKLIWHLTVADLNSKEVDLGLRNKNSEILSSGSYEIRPIMDTLLHVFENQPLVKQKLDNLDRLYKSPLKEEVLEKDLIRILELKGDYNFREPDRHLPKFQDLKQNKYDKFEGFDE